MQMSRMVHGKKDNGIDTITMMIIIIMMFTPLGVVVDVVTDSPYPPGDGASSVGKIIVTQSERKVNRKRDA